MTDRDPYIETPWSLIKPYFEGQHLERLVRHQIESYNDLVGQQLDRTIEMFNPVLIHSDADLDPKTGHYALEVQVTFDNLRMQRPKIHENNGAKKLMFPQEARLRNFTYTSVMTLDLVIKTTVRSGETLDCIQTYNKTIPSVKIGKMPIMLKSSQCVLTQYRHESSVITGECPMDAGGYFIIKGGEKTVLGQERTAENRIFCFNISKTSTKYTWSAEIKSVPDSKCISPKQVELMTCTKNNGFGYPIVVQIPRLKQPVPLFILFRALGVISDKAICEHIVLSTEHSLLLECLRASTIDANELIPIASQETAIDYLVAHMAHDKTASLAEKRRRDFVVTILANDLFPHCRTPNERVLFLGYMTNKLLQVSTEMMPPDDRDAYHNKRVDTTGVLINNLFRNYFNKVVKDMEKQIVHEINGGTWRAKDDPANIITTTNVDKIIKASTIENGIQKALSTGDFGIKHTNSNKVGVAQVLNRLTYSSALSHARRISTPTDKSGKLVPPRKLHGTSWGFVCPAETPEGASVGIVKNLSVMAHITIYSRSAPIYELLAPHIKSLEPRDCYGAVKVFVNGAWIGVVDDAAALYCMLKAAKTSGNINVYTSVVFDYAKAEIRVCNDAGRIMRPLLRVRDGRLILTADVVSRLDAGRLTWDDLLTSSVLGEAVVEYIDPEEQAFSLIAMHPKEVGAKTTHCEIHPSTMFGVLGSCIPFPDHNQSPRNCYQCAQGKQAMGVYMTNFAQRMDKTAYVLAYPMRPLVDTRLMDILKLNRAPSGMNMIVAIATHTGYNQEDSVLINKGAIDRGLSIITLYHTEKDEDKHRTNGDEEIRGRPDRANTRGMKFGNYDKVNAKGLIPENTLVANRDIIIAKKTPIKEARNDPTKIIKFDDQSRVAKTSEETFVDKNYMNTNGDGYSFAKVRLRTVRKPVIGDKFSSRHGQKGTLGNIIPEEDMPFTANGLKPDIIINPHAIPSRMTIGHLKETLLGKALLMLGLFGDGTAFGEFGIEDIRRELLKAGFEANGNEIMYDGMTGKPFESSVFIGPVFYQRLKHMVADKVHSRASGPMVSLTRQPAEGRSRDGGLRFGEMEKDSMVSHGAAAFTRGRMYDSSDKYEVHTCRGCGLVAAYNHEQHVYFCRTCDNRADFARVELPYACKLLFQELMTMNVVPRIMTE